MSAPKLYALSDEQARMIVEVAHWIASVNAGMGNPDTANRFVDLAASMAPLVVPGTAAERLMKVHSKHMSVRTAGSRWVCTECGHAYDGPIGKPQAWAHAFACVLAALTTQEDQS